MNGEMGDVSVVISCFNQAKYVVQAVDSARAQTLHASNIIIVDDGSSDEGTIRVLDELAGTGVQIIHQNNQGVSSARNTGIRASTNTFVAILDGDDRLRPRFLETTLELMNRDDGVLAVSSYMRTFGVLQSTVKPQGGDISAFLAHNNCPAACVVRRDLALSIGGYDEEMRAGFEDWDFFLTLLENSEQQGLRGCHVDIVPEELIEYRTSPSSSNIASMSKRLELMRWIIRKHHQAYQEHLCDALLGMEAISMRRLELWERTVRYHPELLTKKAPSGIFIGEPSFGDGGMAAAVRLRSNNEC